MAYFEFPHTRNYDGDLGYIIKKLEQVSKDTAYLMEEFAKIVVLTQEQIQIMIDNAIAANNIQIARELQELKDRLTLEYKGYVTAQINALTVYVDNQDAHYNELAEGYAEAAETAAKAYTDEQVLDNNLMINPITGEFEDVRNVVDDIVYYFHTGNTLTAYEYDTLELTAQAYDDEQITAYDYDFNGKTILNP